MVYHPRFQSGQKELRTCNIPLEGAVTDRSFEFGRDRISVKGRNIEGSASDIERLEKMNPEVGVNVFGYENPSGVFL